MENLKVALLLHFYQPWWQFPNVLAKVASECYRPILEIVEKMPGFCFSANINYSLIELLDGGHDDIVSGFKDFSENGKIELLGSTAYHPIMPLIPQNMQMVQMIADTQLKRALWGIERNCGGIFLPEMAWSQGILPNLKACGYKWTVIDDTAFACQYGKRNVPYNRISSLQGFKVFLRSNYWSNMIAYDKIGFQEFRDKMGYEMSDWAGNNPAYLFLSLDAETFGHHHPGLIENFLKPILEDWGGGGKRILAPIEEIGRSFPAWDLIKIEDGSWATTEDDYYFDNPYPFWNSKTNPHHQNLWRLVNIALEHREKFGAAWNCLKAVSSCGWWWISGRPHWKPELMKFNACSAMEVINQFGSSEERGRAKEIFEKLISLK